MATAKRKTTKKAAAKKTTAKKTVAKKAATKRVAKKATTTRKKPVVKRTSTARKTAAPKQAAKTVAETVAIGATIAAPEQAFAFGGDMMKQFMEAASATPNMADTSAMGQQTAEQFAKASTVASQSFNDAMELSKENAEAMVESSNIAAGASKTVGAELFNYANKAFSQNVEISKELFACRTLNDMFDLQSKIMKENIDGFFSESVKISELVFEAANNAAEPLQERMQETADRVNKTLNEAA